MKNESIVVMESGASWATCVEEEAGEVSSIVVLARQRGETAENFAARARSRLGSLADSAALRRGVLVCGTGDQPAPAGRECLLKILCEVIGRGGGDEVVLIGDDAKLVRRMSRYVRDLNHGASSGGPRLALRMRPTTDQEPTQRVA
jgi:hypothetical protein